MIPKVVYSWDKNPGSFKDARMYMGLQRSMPAGTGFKRLEPGDPPHACRYCGGSLIYKYPHSHSKADYDKEHGQV